MERHELVFNLTMRYIVTLFFILAIYLVPPPTHGQEYAIGEGDLLKISVYANPDLTTETRVSGEGKITFPLIGEIVVNDLTVTELEKKIAQLLENGYVINPHVSVFIMEYKSKKVTVLGEFTRPGLVELRGNSTLLEVISNAGGITPNAGDMLYIQRKIINPHTKDFGVGVKSGSEKKEDITVTVELKKLLEDGDVRANVAVLDGDNIYVPRAAFVYINGEVRTPGAYKITKGLTVLKAITLAGGFTQKAWQGRTKIIRKTDKGETTITANMDAIVMPEDIITVPESFF